MSDTLNLAQNEAVNYLSGPCLVLAGAGSGKTRVITHKISRLIRAGVEPHAIAAITFTNKAAAEMRERAASLIGRDARALVLCTFHALGVRMLREDGERLGLKPRFSIMDADDVLGILKDAGGTTDVKMARSWQWQISLWKNLGWNAETALTHAGSEDERVTAIVMRRYEERLTAYQAVDFDDLIGMPLKLLRDDVDARAAWQARFRHVLVDEYQDTNSVQYEMLKLLVGERARFTAVGDDDQSIYGWRGASLDNLRRLPVEFPNLKLIKLEQNYRSTSAILAAANAVISANPKIFEKKLWSDLGEGEPVRVVECDHEEHEAERVVARIQSLRAAGGPSIGWKDFAVLYRANHQARVLEQAFRRAQIPYKVSGGQSFFDRAEIKDLCAWLRLIVNNDDDPAFLRAVTTPKRGIGHQTLAALGEFAGSYKVSLFEALSSASIGSVLNRRALDGLLEFGRYVSDLEYRAREVSGREACAAFLREWLADIGYEDHLRAGEDNEKVAAARWQNVQDFCDWMARRAGGDVEDGQVSETRSVMDVAQTIALIMSLKEQNANEDVVTLSTLHASKGLEWPHVVLAGVNEGTLPFKSDDEEITPDRIEEERRLMYVGITRARRTLMVSHVRRKKRGRGPAAQFVAVAPSRFIAEMKLEATTTQEDPMAKIRALRAEFAARAAAHKAV